MAAECKPWRLFLGAVAILAGSSVVLVDQVQRLFDEHNRNLESGRRSLREADLSEYLDPKSTFPRLINAPPNSDVSVHFYIKTSGNHPFLERAEAIADTWGRETDGITFLFDNNNSDEVAQFDQLRPWVSVKYVEGTDVQGDYKDINARDRAALSESYQGQRKKTRAVFADHLAKPGPIPDWVCYIDDDMIVNVPILKVDLVNKEPQCSPDCLIADRHIHGRGFREATVQYSAGGWCINRDLAHRVGALFSDKSDEELNWLGNDDYSFNLDVMKGWLGVTPTDSEKWYSELYWRRRNKPKKLENVGRLCSLSSFSEMVVPTLAVYQTIYVDLEDEKDALLPVKHNTLLSFRR